MIQWSLLCHGCGEKRGVFPQDTEPDIEPWRCDCGASAVESHWVAIEVREMPRISGFSTSESDFTPHWNTAFGRKVRSLSEMKALQARHGTGDAVTKGDGADRHAPRDITRRIQRHRDFTEKVNAGEDFGTGRGVSVTFTEKGNDE